MTGEERSNFDRATNAALAEFLEKEKRDAARGPEDAAARAKADRDRKMQERQREAEAFVCVETLERRLAALERRLATVAAALSLAGTVGKGD